MLWLELEAGRSERGHRQIKLNDEPVRTDAAILAALVAMECRPVDSDRLHELLSALSSPMEKPSWKQHLSERVRAWQEAVPHPHTLDLAMMLLRFHKPYFDRLSEPERIELLERACGDDGL